VSLIKSEVSDDDAPYAQAADFEFYNNGALLRPTRAYSVPGRLPKAPNPTTAMCLIKTWYAGLRTCINWPTTARGAHT
jgi:hypothetical protein